MEERTAMNLPILRKMMSSKDVDDDTVRQGLYDGCVSGSWARGNSFDRTFLHMRYDTSMMKVKKYTVAWSRAYGLCFQEVNGNSFAQIGAKAVGVSPGSYADFRNAKNNHNFPIGGDPEHAADFFFTENINKGAPGGVGNNSEGFFGLFGTNPF